METRKSSMRTRSNSLLQGGASQQTNANGATGTRTRHKSGNASYADLITRAILSSQEKRLTLSEIYDWMVDNVPGLKDQRYLHSAKGWKNAVRHTLSINPRFRKLARLGRPGWWTVDPDFVSRSTAANIGVVSQNNTGASFTTVVCDGQQSQQQQQSNSNGFRGRLSSAPALFLSPIFAQSTAQRSSNTGFPTPTLVGTSNNSRPPSPMSLMSSSSTPIASPKSETIQSPPQITQNPLDTTGTQTVQVWREMGGVGVLAIPRPLPVRMASVNETGTQTDDQYSSDHRNQAGSIPHRFRNMCDYFENVSPVQSPLTSNHAGIDRQSRGLITFDQEQTVTHNQEDQADRAQIRVSLGHCADGRQVLIVTNTSKANHLIDRNGLVGQEGNGQVSIGRKDPRKSAEQVSIGQESNRSSIDFARNRQEFDRQMFGVDQRLGSPLIGNQQLVSSSICDHQAISSSIRKQQQLTSPAPSDHLLLISSSISDQQLTSPSITDQHHMPSLIADQQLFSPSINSDHSNDSYQITDLSGQVPITVISPPTLERLPEDLEGINIDPTVRCDVIAVIKYEQKLVQGGSIMMPKLEPIMEYD